MKANVETVRTVDLGYDQLLVFEGRREGRVSVLYGATWLTQEGDADDAILRAGTERSLVGGRTVMQGLEAARVQVTEPGAIGLAAWLRQAWHGVRRQVTRVQLGPVAAEPCA